ncbi:lipocalin-like domain-containing protein [Streptomyces sp. ADMS]|uniref:lipocalin-like domain-containing protein n=1 Tax=Streptomyces sp. ADMS TaxID=3071415 RepID=UPI00296F31B8|nr:lipocalin-like domain-containing protein [Streptomyces sp. ADMS]MDW4907703.1 lipocalin-like domain-containing protein [Streptomyces sp. ADMS]
MDDIVGAWELTGFLANRGDAVRRPLGEKPGGLLLYTADGWMSALLTADSGGPAER